MSCPICANDTDPKFRPFCSLRCADMDLGKWLTGAYAVPSSDEDDAENVDQAIQDAARQTH